MRPHAPALSLLGVLLAGTAFAQPTTDRLGTSVLPTAYRIAITANMTSLALAGHETIAVTTAAGVATITLNQAGLTLAHATIDGTPAAIAQNDAAQTVTLRPAAPLAPGHHTIDIAYTGPIPASPAGIYYDDYRTPSGQQHRMLVTQFEVADARRMFPCWDEPDFKATFQLTATLPAAYVPVSNMPVASVTPAPNGQKTVAFATTPRMSTYLLALFAGDLSALRGQGGGTPIGVYAPTGEQQNGAYALSAASEILPYYNTYFAVRYPLPKLDLIAIPGNYEAGAMENWGAISFIDDALLFDPATSTAATKETIFLDVAHEMAHQWSGDLVTMKWWDDIWLNEGFATWMENKATAHFNPTWQIWPRQHSDREAAMAVDALSTTHAIHQTIHNVSEAEAAFDLITYQKGSAVIRMIEDWLSPDTFRAGMRAYMRAHAYGNTDDADLWAALSGASHQNVARVATSFTDQPGVPQVNVARACANRQTTLTLTQSRFTLNDPTAAKLTWTIPVEVGGPDVTPQRTLLGAEPATLRFPGCNTALKANLGENGYFRTHYDHASLAALATAFPRLAPADRTNLLGDQFALFEAGTAPLTDYLDLLRRLPANPSVEVLQDTIRHLVTLDTLVRGSPVRAPFRAYASTLLRPQLARLGWTPRPDESFLNALLRPLLIQALGRFQDPTVTAEARRRFAEFVRHPASLPPNLRGPVLMIVGHDADPATYAQLGQLAAHATDTEEKLRDFQALAAAANPALMARSIKLATSGIIPNGRIVYALAMVASGSDDPDLAWRLVQPQIPAILPRLTAQARTFILPGLLFDSANTSLAQAMLANPLSNTTPGAHLQAERAASSVQNRAAERARALPQLAAWLNTPHGA